MPERRIIIIGAGPAGLTLGRLLQCHSIPFTIYERDASPNARLQGGSLDLHPASGQRALLECGLIDAFNKHARYHDQDFRVADKDGKIWLDYKAPPDAKGRPEIDRLVLRNILLESIEPKSIRWGHHVSIVKRQDDGRFEVHFKDREDTEVADLVIGADGGRSKVRSLLTDVQPYYAGMTMIDSRIYNLDEKYPDMGKFLGRGSLFAFGQRRGLLAQRNGDGSIRVYPCLQVPESWAFDPALNWDDTEKIKEMLLVSFFENWDDRLKDLVRYADAPIFPRPVYQVPLGSRWETQKGLTLVGDAAHLMSPFAGEGVNLAMLDALELANAIVENPTDLDEAIRKYESNIYDRADAANRMAQEGMKRALMDDAPKTYVEETSKIIELLADGRLPE
ncbi:hypothetical protein VTN96DRAFT_937 [Rasamsonia emersonii]|uniref:Monooxygenase n=1 Tax=Rasamsonia emersonii (strain ATCC 16479 / CBS 393.64 / IMI 116815) TaxID=1408163 RepID=A0A0F4YLP7_RASE3|nr:Monooxygenase [Rasamsonia emersonii CBS 393.64]KKA19139.1 Monooxygenase [Rasamsonia emersonii CBS 393.64]